MHAYIWLILALIHNHLAYGARILILPNAWVSQVTKLGSIGNELVARHHEVYMVVSETFPMEKIPDVSKDIKFVTFRVKHADLMTTLNDPEDFFKEMIEGKSPIWDLRTHPGSLLDACRNVLEDEAMYEKLKSLEFDLVIVAAWPSTRCLMVLPYKLDVPYVSITANFEPWLNRNPQLPSFVPFHLQHPALTDDMSFWERVQNVWSAVAWVWWIDQVPMASPDLVRQYAPNRTPVSLNQIAGQSLLWLLDIDPVIDYPRPVMPNEINIGGLSTRPANPLNDELEQFMSAAKKGVVLLSFGSGPAALSSHMLKILDGLKMISRDYHFLIRWHPSSTPSVPANMKLLPYISQQDIMGHPQTKLFLTHGGVESQFEALYHAVPLLNFPLYWDQPYNAKRADYHGISLTINMHNFTAQDVFIGVKELLENPTYTENVQRLSAIFRSRPMTSRERAAFWVEHVIQHGGLHLRSRALDMPAYQFLMLDIFFFLVAVLGIGAVLTYATFRICRKCVGLQ